MSKPPSDKIAIPNKSMLQQIDLRQTFTALRHRNYRLWFTGQSVSLFGSWMQTAAQGFLVYDLTHSPVYLGYVGFAAGIPTWFFMLWGGVIADRISRRTLLLVTQTALMLLAVVLAWLTFSQMVEPWHIVALAFLGGIANAFDAPARLAFVSEMVPRDDMSNAIALNSTMFNIATTLGPAVSGLTYAAFGPGWCFTINGISFLAVITALCMMRITPVERQISIRPLLAELTEGIRYVGRHSMIRSIILITAVTALFGISFVTLIPAWAVMVLGGDATTNGVLLSARGIGALLCALLIASLGRFQFKGKLMTLGLFTFPLLLFAFSLVNWLPFSMVVIAGIGIAHIMIMNLSNTLLQGLVDDRLRGRVMSVFSLTFFGFMPIGALFIGFLAEGFGSAIAIAINASMLFIIVVLFWFLAPRLRRLS